METELSAIERKTLSLIKNLKSFQSVEVLAEKTGMKKDSLIKALSILEEKGFVDKKEKVLEEVSLTKTGISVVKKGFPEKIFLNGLKKPVGIKDYKKKSKLKEQEFNISMGLLKRNDCIKIEKGLICKKNNEKFLKELNQKEELINKINKKKPFYLKKEDEKYVEEFLKRGLVVKKIRVVRQYRINENGKKILKNLKEDLIEKLTPKMILDGTWKNKKFRSYNLRTKYPSSFGKKHFLKEMTGLIKQIFIEMGFKEMKSDYVETCFWNFDNCFMRQDHPNREIMDTYFLKYPSKGRIPEDLSKIIKSVHEDGWKTGSKGWGGEWSKKEAEKLILRTHTTATTFRMLSKCFKPPYKFFSVDRIFRNETLDFKHLHEFHQVEGVIVADKPLSLANLIAVLKEFYKKMGVKKLRFKPTYNPYTEPSMEIFAYLPKLKKWVELGNSGVFRPEVLLPHGITKPVIAWGLGLERLAMLCYGIDDIRQVYGHFVDVENIKKTKPIFKVSE